VYKPKQDIHSPQLATIFIWLQTRNLRLVQTFLADRTQDKYANVILGIKRILLLTLNMLYDLLFEYVDNITGFNFIFTIK